MKYKEEFFKKQDELEKITNRNHLLEDQVKRCMEEKKKKEEEAKKRYLATVYCKNCMYVEDVTILPGIAIKDGNCSNCKVQGGLLPVIMYPGKRHA